MANELKVSHEFLKRYLEYVEHTESPKIMHVWSAISAASACMGRHVWLPFGIGDIYPNMYVLLSGPPGTRKSQAMKYSCSLVAKYTKVRFAPDDTGGQRQGLIGALQGDILDEDEKDMMDGIDTADAAAALADLGNLEMDINSPDKHQIFAWASEFGTIMGEANATVARLLIKVWDGEDYTYKLKNTEQCLENPLMTILGGTTPADIAKILPVDSIGQGFMSRFVLVHAPAREKRVARPYLCPELAKEIADTFAWLSYEMAGAMEETKEAAALLDKIYMSERKPLEDTRFIYYGERRHTHLMKLAMVLAGLRRSMKVEIVDVQQADDLLYHTEQYMPEALGQFGLSPIGAAKQKMLEFLQHAKGPVQNTILWHVMSRDMKRVDYKNALADFLNSGKIKELNTNAGLSFIYVDDLADVWEDLAEVPTEDMK